MLARDWYYNERRQIGLDSAVASIYDRHDDSDLRARAALTMLGVQRGWRIADIGCGNGVLACEAAQMGAEVDAIDISPAMLALANIQARDRRHNRAGADIDENPVGVQDVRADLHLTRRHEPCMAFIDTAGRQAVE